MEAPDIEVQVSERYVPPSSQLRETSVGDVYIVNAFFRDDQAPMTGDDISKASDVLAYQREDLLPLLRPPLPSRILDKLLHIGSAEWWYWDRLDMAFPREQLPDDPLQRLSMVRDFTNQNLPVLEDKTETFEKMGEGWSSRKLVRRAAWHERDHTNEIRNLLEDLAR